MEKFLGEKVKLQKFSTKSEFFSEIGGKCETGGKCVIATEGMDNPDQDIMDIIRTRQKNWTGHILRGNSLQREMI